MISSTDGRAARRRAASPSCMRHDGLEALEQEVGGVADGLAGDVQLVVGVGVHEDEVARRPCTRTASSRLSTLAVSTFTPALKVLSTTLPESTFFSLVRTKAGPLPGLTCWNSTTVQSWPPSSLSTRPFLRSFVVATVAESPGLQRGGYRGAVAAAGVNSASSSLVVMVSSSGPPSASGRTTRCPRSGHRPGPGGRPPARR